MKVSFAELKFLLKHSSIYGVGNILSQLVAFLLLPMYTHYLTPTDYGVMELTGVTIGMIGIVMGVGLAESISRFYFEYNEKKERNAVISTAYIIVTFVSLIALAVISPFIPAVAELILDSRDYFELLMISFVSLAFGMVIDVGQLYLRVLQKSTIYIFITLTNLVINVSLNILFIAVLKYGVIGVFYAGLITKLLVGLPMTIIIIRQVGIRFDLILAKKMLNYSIPLIPSHMAHAVVNYSDRYFIKFFLSLHDAGIYGIANKIGTAIHMLVTSPFIMTFLPRRFEIAEQENPNDKLCSIYDYYMMGIVCAGLAVSVLSEEIITIMTSPEFYGAAKYIPLIALTMVILGMRYHFEFGILYMKKTKYYMYVNFITSFIHIVLNLLLIKEYGLWGALYASLIAVSLTTFLVYLVSQRLYKINFNHFRNVKLIFYAISMYFVTTLFPISIGIVYSILFKVGCIFIFIVMLYILVLSREEQVKFKELSGSIIKMRYR